MGRRFGPFETTELLGQGGMGVVYRARHLASDEPAALKTLNLPNPAGLAGLRREIRTLARLDHPGVVRILAHGTEKGVPWYAMELIEGSTLRRHFGLVGPEPQEPWWTDSLARPPQGPRRSGRRRPPPARAAPGDERLGEVATVLHGVCLALAHVHAQGVVHRDLKPENIVLRSDGQPVIVDFGLSSLSPARDWRESLGGDASSGGTRFYQAPELAAGRSSDARADMYSLGCILHELVLGAPPGMHGPWRPAAAAGLPPELGALLQGLLARDPLARMGIAAEAGAVLAEFAAPRPAPHAPGPAAVSPPVPLLRPAFVGRGPVAAGLDTMLVQTRAGCGSVVLLAGESGIGKTRLCLETARQAAHHGFVVLEGGSQPLQDCGSPPVLSVFHEPLLAALDFWHSGSDSAPGPLPPPAELALLARVQPALLEAVGSALPPPPENLAWAQVEERLQAALFGIFASLARSRPLLVILDDLQWADGLSLSVLGHLAGRLAGGGLRCLILGTYRLDEAPEGLAGLAARPEVKTITLARLDDGDIERLAASMLGTGDLASGLRQEVAARAHGNPYFAAELVRGCVEDGHLVHRRGRGWQPGRPAGGPIAFPDTLAELLDRRLTRIEGPAEELLAAAATAGRRVDLELLADALGRAIGELDEPARELRRRLVWEEDRAGELAFSHDRLREAAYRRQRRRTRRDNHGRIAAALERSGQSRAPADAAAIGHHWAAAGRGDLAAPHYLQAAEQALERYACSEADRLFRRFLASSAGRLDQTTVRARLSWAAGLDYCGREVRAAAVLRQALCAARHLGDKGLEGEAHYLRAKLAIGHGRHALARRESRKALPLLRAAGKRVLEAKLEGHLGAIAYREGRLDEALAHYRQAARIFVRIGDQEGRCWMAADIALVDYSLGRFSRASARLRGCLALARRIGNLEHETNFLRFLGRVEGERGRTDRAAEYLLAALALHRRHGNRRREAFDLVQLAEVVASGGDHRRALAILAEAEPLVREFADQRSLAGSLTTRGRIAAVEGRLPEALECLSQAADLFRRLGLLPLVADVLESRGWVEIMQGRSEAARTSLERALEALPAGFDQDFVHGIELRRIEILLAEDQDAAAAAALDRLAGSGLAGWLPTHRNWLGLLRGLLAARAGDLRQGRALCLQAARQRRWSDHLPGRPWAQILLAGLARRNGRPPAEAERWLRGARDSIAELNCHSLDLLVLCEQGELELDRGGSAAAALAEGLRLADAMGLLAASPLRRPLNELARRAAAAGREV